MVETSSNNDNPAPHISTSQEFYTFFQREESQLRSLIDSLEFTDLTSADRASSIEQCLAGITKLSNAVKDASVFLPAYDQRTYSQGIKSLQEHLQDARARFAPKQKFAFKNAKKVTTTPAPKSTSADDIVLNPNGPPPPPPPTSIPQPTAQTKDKIVYISQTTSTSPSTSTTSTSPSPTNCHNCLITLPPPSTPTDASPLPSLTLRNLTSCVVLLPHPITGPVHLTNIHNTVLLLSCRQFRMHESTGVDVYLNVPSRPIVEGCAGIRFAPAPPENVMGLDAATTEAEAKENLWDQVDDFGWLVFGRASPNWRVLLPDERLADGVWTALRGIGEGAESGAEGLRKGLEIAGVYSSSLS